MKHTSYQVPAPTCFGVEFIKKVLSLQHVFQVLSPLTFVIKVKRLKLLKLRITHHQVYVHIGAQTTPQSNEPPLLHNHSHFFFLRCAHKHPYQYVIQRYLVRLKGAMYPILGYTVYSLVHCIP